MGAKAFPRAAVLSSNSKLIRILVGSRKEQVSIQMSSRVATLKQRSRIRMAQSILFTLTQVISKGIPGTFGKSSKKKLSSRHAEKKDSE